MARVRLALVVPVVALAVLAASALPATGQDWFPAGSFEDGLDGWLPANATFVNCEPLEGSGSLGFASLGTASSVTRSIPGPFPAGEFVLTGWTWLQTGAADVTVKLAFIHESGSPTGVTVQDLLPDGTEPTPFTLTAFVGIPTESAELSFHLGNGAAELCVDSVSLTSEDPSPTPSPTSTPTTPPGATSTPTMTSTPTPVPATATSTATPTSSPVPPATSSPTATPSPTLGPTFAFTNGGFEEGLDGWSKYGGTLGITSNALTGSTAGLLSSDTESTKWAYQAVRIDPTQHYEFSGNVQAGGGISEAYLRISWYASSDATGSALSTSDSFQRTGPGGYVYLTTGAVQPPAGAASARVRVLLAPAGAAAASVSIDDVSFHTTSAPTPTPAPSGTPSPVATGAPSPTPTFALLGATAARRAGENGSASPAADDVSSQALAAPAAPEATSPSEADSVTPATVAEIASIRSEAQASEAPREQPPPVTFTDPSRPPNHISWPWVVGAVLLVLGIGGAYLQNRGPAR